MKTQNFETQIIRDYRSELISLNARIEYCKGAIATGLEKWEEKEYNGVIEDCEDRKKQIKRIFETINVA